MLNFHLNDLTELISYCRRGVEALETIADELHKWNEGMDV